MEYVHCNLCGADETIVRYPSTLHQHQTKEDWRAFACTHDGYAQHRTIVQCHQCGLVYANPRLDSRDLLDTYESLKDSLYLKEWEGRVLTFEKHRKPLELLASPQDGRYFWTWAAIPAVSSKSQCTTDVRLGG